ncbi:MAG: zinc ribbon domain-containing protein [Phycisphaerae bacterium]|nr:zinc ribbon domain-containing protein [Phycisphaerae bacterium]
MPTYDYACGACEHRFELFQSMTASAVKKCPSCGKLKVRRLIGTGAGIIFKGSGFYCTDYRGKEYSEAAKKESSGGGLSGESSGGVAKESGAKEPAGGASTTVAAPAASGAGSGKKNETAASSGT